MLARRSRLPGVRGSGKIGSAIRAASPQHPRGLQRRKVFEPNLVPFRYDGDNLGRTNRGGRQCDDASSSSD
jgi:hypothetical protein